MQAGLRFPFSTTVVGARLVYGLGDPVDTVSVQCLWANNGVLRGVQDGRCGRVHRCLSSLLPVGFSE